MPRPLSFPTLAFNFNDQYDLRGIVSALNSVACTGILMLSTRAIEFSGLEYLFALFQAARSTSDQELYLQLDHCQDLGLIQRCVSLGFDLIMADFSTFDFRKNVELTKQAVEIARAKGVKVEGELGLVPVLTENFNGPNAKPTDPDRAEEFVTLTGIDLLAPSVGNYHGVLQSKPIPNVSHIKTLSNRLKTPLVFHGGDYLTNETLIESVNAGIAKINFGPELRAAYVQSLTYACETATSFTDQRPLLSSATKSVAAAVVHRLRILNDR